MHQMRALIAVSRKRARLNPRVLAALESFTVQQFADCTLCDAQQAHPSIDETTEIEVHHGT